MITRITRELEELGQSEIQSNIIGKKFTNQRSKTFPMFGTYEFIYYENIGVTQKEYFEIVSEIDSYDKFQPMLAHDYTKKPQDTGFSQPKLDGIRCIVYIFHLWCRIVM